MILPFFLPIIEYCLLRAFIRFFYPLLESIRLRLGVGSHRFQLRLTLHTFTLLNLGIVVLKQAYQPFIFHQLLHLLLRFNPNKFSRSSHHQQLQYCEKIEKLISFALAFPGFFLQLRFSTATGSQQAAIYPVCWTLNSACFWILCLSVLALRASSYSCSRLRLQPHSGFSYLACTIVCPNGSLCTGQALCSWAGGKGVRLVNQRLNDLAHWLAVFGGGKEHIQE